MELLERDGPLAALVVARTLAAQGNGRVVFVTGEPGIGKTSLVTEFVNHLDADARVLFGSCDDLAIPRPLGPIRDLVGVVTMSRLAEGDTERVHLGGTQSRRRVFTSREDASVSCA